MRSNYYCSCVIRVCEQNSRMARKCKSCKCFNRFRQSFLKLFNHKTGCLAAERKSNGLTPAVGHKHVEVSLRYTTLQYIPSPSEVKELYSTSIANCVFNSFLSYTAIMFGIVTIHAI